MMPKRERVEKQKTRARSETKVSETEKTVSNEALKSEMDSILEDIDAVLVSNAEEFVNQYIQKGGE